MPDIEHQNLSTVMTVCTEINTYGDFGGWGKHK